MIPFEIGNRVVMVDRCTPPGQWPRVGVKLPHYDSQEEAAAAREKCHRRLREICQRAYEEGRLTLPDDKAAG